MSKIEEEPYTVTSVRRKGDVKYEWDPEYGGIVAVPPGLYWFEITYCNYLRTNRVAVKAKDELEAFMLGQQRLNKTKKHYNKYGKNKKEQTS